jgi:hypothetical protein
LKVIDKCIAVTGIIMDATAAWQNPNKDGVRHEGDGDAHGWLKLDPEFEHLLNDGNRTTEGGNLVFEPVCIFKVKQKDAKAACKDYKSAIVIPPVGTHVLLIGTLVQDMEKLPGHAQHIEIHPVSFIIPIL